MRLHHCAANKRKPPCLNPSTHTHTHTHIHAGERARLGGALASQAQPPKPRDIIKKGADSGEHTHAHTLPHTHTDTHYVQALLCICHNNRTASDKSNPNRRHTHTYTHTNTHMGLFSRLQSNVLITAALAGLFNFACGNLDREEHRRG